MSSISKLRKLLKNPKGFWGDSRAIAGLYERGAAELRARRIGKPVFASEDDGVARTRVGDRFLYLPWIPEHGDSLLNLIDPEREVTAPLTLFREASDLRQRKAINTFAMEQPQRYRRHLLRALTPLMHSASGFIFTLDWTPPMRLLALACRELGMPTVLIPHESIFAERSAYYVDRLTGADVPVCDLVLCWGDLQRSIFLERGYPAERLRTVGSPKLDLALRAQAEFAPDVYARLYGLDPGVPTFLFALQPLDSQYDAQVAREAQTRAVLDLAKLASEHQAQLIVRYPPAGHAVLEADVVRELERADHVAIDDGKPYLVRPTEAIKQAAAVFSINSTMLLEASLMGKPAVSTRYVESKIPWGDAGVVQARDQAALRATVARILAGQMQPGQEGREWTAQAFSVGAFDGRSVQRIRQALDELKGTPRQPRAADEASAHLFEDRFATSSAIAAFESEPQQSMAHLEAMLGYRRLLCAPNVRSAQTADAFVTWGIAPRPSRQKHNQLARDLNRSRVIVEDGFLRSVQIGLSGTPGLSLICDTKTAYYDATRPSRLEDRLNSATELSAAQRSRAERCMTSLRESRLSKYNHAPDTRIPYGQGPRVLVVDQRAGDLSVERGLADAETFARMLDDAFRERPAHTILVKQHPDATGGGKSAYLSDAVLAPYSSNPRLQLIREDVNPHTLFDQVEEVFVVTSGMGMEALIAGLRVRCYGIPFYAGWGATDDVQPVRRRNRRRSALEIFHFAYIESSRYFAPQLQRGADLEDVLEYLSLQKRIRGPLASRASDKDNVEATLHGLRRYKARSRSLQAAGKATGRSARCTLQAHR